MHYVMVPTEADKSGHRAMKHEIRSVQILRGIAAVAVAFYHTHLILLQRTDVDVLGALALHGKVGVNIFFVLSGFIILKAHWKDIGTPKSIPNYAFRRFVRLYPLYWIFSLAYMAAAYAGLGDPDFSWEPMNLLAAFTLYEFTPDPTMPLQVAWTLFYEVKFYALFMLFLISPRVGTAAFALWAAATVFCVVTTGKVDAGWLSPWMLYFMVGMAVYVISTRLPKWTAWPICAAASVFAAIYVAVPSLHVTYGGQGNILPSLLWLLPTCALLLLSAVLADRPRSGQERRGLWTLLGDASYSVYLVHSAVISVSVVIGVKLGLLDVGGGYPLFFAVFLMSVIAGYIAHVLIEKPLLQWLRRRRSTNPETSHDVTIA